VPSNNRMNLTALRPHVILGVRHSGARRVVSEQIHALQGRQCLAVTFDEATEQWIFDFEHKAMLTVASPWRIIVGGRIRLGWRDHGQPFGLPSPVNGVSEATKFLGGVEVKSASVAAETSDLVISFVSGCRLEVFNGSSGYEGWTLNAPGGERFVAQGGGDLVRFERDV